MDLVLFNAFQLIIFNFVFFRLAQSVKLMIAIAIFFTFTLQFYVPMSIIWKGIQHKIAPEKQNWTEYALRVALVVSFIRYCIKIVSDLDFIVYYQMLLCYSTTHTQKI